MSESRIDKNAYDSLRNDLLKGIVTASERARIGRENEVRVKEIEKERLYYERERDNLRDTVNYLVKLYKNIEKYAQDRKELSLQLLKEAIEKSGLIVPDADVEGIHLRIAGKMARIVNAAGQDINLREGGAFRSVIGILMKYTLIAFQPNKIQAMFLDESFAALSDTTADNMRQYLSVFAEDMLIVGIEQRSYLYQGIDREVYEAVKGEEGTTIRRIE